MLKKQLLVALIFFSFSLIGSDSLTAELNKEELANQMQLFEDYLKSSNNIQPNVLKAYRLYCDKYAQQTSNNDASEHEKNQLAISFTSWLVNTHKNAKKIEKSINKVLERAIGHAAGLKAKDAIFDRHYGFKIEANESAIRGDYNAAEEPYIHTIRYLSGNQRTAAMEACGTITRVADAIFRACTQGRVTRDESDYNQFLVSATEWFNEKTKLHLRHKYHDLDLNNSSNDYFKSIEDQYNTKTPKQAVPYHCSRAGLLNKSRTLIALYDNFSSSLDQYRDICNEQNEWLETSLKDLEDNAGLVQSTLKAQRILAIQRTKKNERLETALKDLEDDTLLLKPSKRKRVSFPGDDENKQNPCAQEGKYHHFLAHIEHYYNRMDHSPQKIKLDFWKNCKSHFDAYKNKIKNSSSEYEKNNLMLALTLLIETEKISGDKAEEDFRNAYYERQNKNAENLLQTWLKKQASDNNTLLAHTPSTEYSAMSELFDTWSHAKFKYPDAPCEKHVNDCFKSHCKQHPSDSFKEHCQKHASSFFNEHCESDVEKSTLLLDIASNKSSQINQSEYFVLSKLHNRLLKKNLWPARKSYFSSLSDKSNYDQGVFIKALSMIDNHYTTQKKDLYASLGIDYANRKLGFEAQPISMIDLVKLRKQRAQLKADYIKLIAEQACNKDQDAVMLEQDEVDVVQSTEEDYVDAFVGVNQAYAGLLTQLSNNQYQYVPFSEQGAELTVLVQSK